jgi:hypothetical protein
MSVMSLVYIVYAFFFYPQASDLGEVRITHALGARKIQNIAAGRYYLWHEHVVPLVLWSERKIQQLLCPRDLKP